MARYQLCIIIIIIIIIWRVYIQSVKSKHLHTFIEKHSFSKTYALTRGEVTGEEKTLRLK